jgi:hypothetical protein
LLPEAEDARWAGATFAEQRRVRVQSVISEGGQAMLTVAGAARCNLTLVADSCA